MSVVEARIDAGISIQENQVSYFKPPVSIQASLLINFKRNGLCNPFPKTMFID